MTEATDINLLPLPEGESSSFGDYEVHTNETMTDYARACVEANTAPLQAEIERLQAVVDFLGSVIATHAADTREYQKRISQAEAHAEQMAEAFREWWAAHRPVGWTEDQHRACPYVNLPTDADKALVEAMLRNQEEGRG